MRVIYFGTVCELLEYERELSTCDAKPSIATIVFEESLLQGMKSNGVDVEVYSFPMLPIFPYYKRLWWGSKKEKLACGYECTWLKTINIPVLKQISRKMAGRYALKKWIKENKGHDCAILTYSMPPFLVKDIIKYSRKYCVKCFAVVPDLLRDMYINSVDNCIVAKLKQWYLNRAIRFQGAYDGYIYLTEAMSEVVNSKKPYIVMEGIAETFPIVEAGESKKATPQAIMYAGMLFEKYGIMNLIDAFERADIQDTELWLFGNGNAVPKILERAKQNPRIKYMGQKSRQEILWYEKQAALLVNPRSSKDEFTKYSFPSKTIEYMMSGTALLTTKLPGIPQEYYQYVYFCEDNDVQSLADALTEAMGGTPQDREMIGQRAASFIKHEKNATRQAYRIMKFMQEVKDDFEDQ